MIPARALARFEYMLRRLPLIALTDPPKAAKLRRVIMLTVVYYKYRSMRTRAGAYLARNIRFRGIWRNWRDAGLGPLDDRALIRFCLFDKSTVFKLAAGMALDPRMDSINPFSRYWKRVDPWRRPTCDVLDVCVLVLREMATSGCQHTLESDLGIPRGVLGKYLSRGKKVLLSFLKASHSARMGLLAPELGEAAHYALEAQHGECPRKNVLFPYALDGTIVGVMKPQDPHLFNMYWSATKRMSAVNQLILVSALGTIVAYRSCLPGTVTDSRGAEPIFAMLFERKRKPSKARRPRRLRLLCVLPRFSRCRARRSPISAHKRRSPFPRVA